MDRNQFIQQAITSGVKLENMNPALQEAGFDPLTTSEALMIKDNTFGQNALQRAGQNIASIGTGLKTMLGAAGQYINNDEFQQQVNQQALGYLKSKTPGQIIYDINNLMVEPMAADKSIGEILTQNPIKTLDDIKSSVIARPGFAGLYALPAAGPISKGAKRMLGKNAQKVTSAVEKIPGVKGIIGTSKEINDIINTTKQASTGSMDRLRVKQASISNATNEQVAQAIKNLEEGIREGDAATLKVTDDLAELSNEINNVYSNLGYGETGKDLAIAQYISRKTGSKTPIAKIQDVMEGKAESNTIKLTPEEYGTLYKQASDLYDTGAIRPIKHKATAEATREGLVEEGVKKYRDPQDKLYGTHSYEDLARGLRDGAYESEIAKFEYGQRVQDAIDQINKAGISRKIKPGDVVKDTEVVISPKLLQEKFGTSLVHGENVTNDIKELTRGLNKAEIEQYADDLYAFKKDDIKAIQNAFAPSKTVFNSGALGSLGGLAKQTVLATPSYVAGNFLANELINPMTGVNFADTLKVLFSPVGDLPQSIRRSASYTGYLENKLPAYPKISDVYKKLKSEIKVGLENKQYDKLPEAIGMMFNYPIFRAAQSLETAQRSANYLKQAENYAKETGRTVESVLNEAKQNAGNNKLGRLLKGRVEKYLGDYTGRNYYLPPSIRDFGSILAPFTRPYIQGTRQMFNLYKDYPVQAQLMATVPGIKGSEISREAVEAGIPESKDGGGYPISAPYGRNTPGRVIYNPYHVFSAVSDLIRNPSETLSGNYLPFAWANAIAGRTRYGNEAKLPNQVTINGQNVILDNNGNVMVDSSGAIKRAEPNLIDKAKLFLAQTANAYTTVNFINQNIIRNAAALMGENYYRPSDYSIFGQIGDFSIPFLMQGDMMRTPQTPEEVNMNQFGFRYEDVYPKKRETISSRIGARARKKFARKQQRNKGR